jgi:hypothetical protein
MLDINVVITFKMCCINYMSNQVTSLRAVAKKKCEETEGNFRNRDGGQDRPIPKKAKYLAILSMDDIPIRELPVDEARVVSVLKSHPDSKKLGVLERESLANEVIDVLDQLEGEEREIAAKLFRLVLGAEEHVPAEYMNAVTEITFATAAEKQAALVKKEMVDTGVQRPFMIAQFSREIKQKGKYHKELPELEGGIAEMDEDIQKLARAALKTLFGMGGNGETLEALTLLEWIPSRTIDDYGPAGAILEVCDLWQKIRDETDADDEIAMAGLCALGVILDDQIKATGMASRIIDNLSIDFEDVHEGIVKAVKITQA